MCVHNAVSVSHDRTVESKPQLYAVVLSLPAVPKMALETLPVCDLRTISGALRIALSPSTFRFFVLRPPSAGISSGTSSLPGMVVSHNPMRWSHEAVRRWEPAELAVMEESGAVCRCSVARGFALVRACAFVLVALVAGRSALEIPEMVSWVNCPVRSCDAVATVIVWDSFAEDWEERRQKEVIGALCKRALKVMFLE